MSKQNSACAYYSTTGAGLGALAWGTGKVDLMGFSRGSDLAGTLIIKDSATVILTISASQNVSFATPIALNGPVTMTSSGGDHFLVFYRKCGV